VYYFVVVWTENSSLSVEVYDFRTANSAILLCILCDLILLFLNISIGVLSFFVQPCSLEKDDDAFDKELV